MRYPRKNRGFEQAARLPLDGRGLPRARARELLLANAWREVAGPTLAPLVSALDVRRGVLEIHVATGDRSWLPTLAEILPDLAARVALRARALRVSRYRVHGLGTDFPPTVRALPVLADDSDTSAGRPPENATASDDDSGLDPSRRLERIMEAYLRRR